MLYYETKKIQVKAKKAVLDTIKKYENPFNRNGTLKIFFSPRECPLCLFDGANGRGACGACPHEVVNKTVCGASLLEVCKVYNAIKDEKLTDKQKEKITKVFNKRVVWLTKHLLEKL